MASCNLTSAIIRTAVTLLMAVSPLCGLFAASVPDYQVSIVTVDPGSVIYELEGHAGLRLKGNGMDVVVNWGVFDFNSPNFVYRFVSGDTDYLCVAEPTEYFLRQYAVRSPGRGVSEQVIPMDSVQTAELFERLRINLLPENRTYRYNYVKDNCATRPVEIIEQILGHTVTSDSIPAAFKRGDSFRDVMRHYHANYPWYQFGIDLALGSGIDYPLSAREYIFAPHLLRTMIPSTPVEILPSVPGGVVCGPTPFLMTPTCVFWALFAVMAVLILFVRGQAARWGSTIWFAALTFGGCVVAYLVFLSTHEATTPNYNLLWLNPLSICGIFSIWITKLKKVWICYHFANFAAVIAYAIVWAAGIQQGNPAFVPLLATSLLVSANWLTTRSGLRTHN